MVDLGLGMASALAAKLLADLGAKVRRFQPPDDPFAALYPAYRSWHAKAETLIVPDPSDARVAAALGNADACLTGGEDFPGVGWAPDVAAIAARHPHLVALEIEGFPSDGALAGQPAVEILAQARSGMTYEQFSDRPVRIGFEAGAYGAALHGLTALLGALCRRERDGVGQVVRPSLLESVLTFATQFWLRAERPPGSFDVVMPKDPHPLILRCRDRRHIHFVLGSSGSKGRLYRILKIDDPTVGPEDNGMPTGHGNPKNFFGDIDVLAAHVAEFDCDDLLTQMLAAGIAVNPVLEPGRCWDDEQVTHLGVVERDVGGERYVALPIHGGVTPFEAARKLSPDVAEGAPPLAGVRVLDFGLLAAGPFSSVALGDLGADVIKVEAPQGDPTRAFFRAFAAFNRGKRSIAIDIETLDGLEVGRRLAATAHVLMSNFRPGASARLEIDPASQHAVDADKIVLEATGCGRSGPQRGRAGFDMIYQAFCGHETRAGGVANRPMWNRSSMVDYVLGLLNSVAVLTALWRRFRGAAGADLEASLLDAGVFLISELVQRPDGRFVGAPPLNAAQTGYHPAEALYPCADDWVAVAARDAAMAQALARALGLALGPREEWGEAEASAIQTALVGLTSAEALSTLGAAGVWCAPCVRNGEDLLEKGSAPQGLVAISHHPTYGEVRQIGALFRLGDGRCTAPRGASPLGADTDAILSELGYSTEQITDFRARRIVA